MTPRGFMATLLAEAERRETELTPAQRAAREAERESVALEAAERVVISRARVDEKYGNELLARLKLLIKRSHAAKRGSRTKWTWLDDVTLVTLVNAEVKDQRAAGGRGNMRLAAHTVAEQFLGDEEKGESLYVRYMRVTKRG